MVERENKWREFINSRRMPYKTAFEILEAINLEDKATAPADFIEGMMIVYGCRPIDKEAERNFKSFLAAVYNWGRIVGIRGERKRRKKGGKHFA